MPYVKPGVEITQVQETATPILVSPALNATVVGKGHYWHDPESDAAVYSTVYSGTSMSTISLSDFSAYDNVQDADLVVVDFVITKGGAAGDIKHLVEGTDFTVSTGSGSSIAISGSLSHNGYDITEANVRVGFRSEKPDSEGFKSLDSLQAIRDELGAVVSWNPLAYGTYLAQINSASIVTSYGTADVDGVLDELGLKETYALAFLDDDVSVATIKTHCETYSNAVNKKERVAFVNKQINFTSSKEHAESSSEKTNTADAIRDANSGYGSKRIFSTHPDVAYVQETRHISTIHPDFVDASFKDQTAVNFETYGAYCQFVGTTKANGKTYAAGTDITATVWADLIAEGLHSLDVLAPVPGSYYCAANAGLLISQRPEQPLTNLPIAGLVKTYGSQDYFSEAQLNSMAGGGTYIMTQDVSNGPIYSRHQVSTDITSVAYRELSVTKALDYTAKFIRDGIKPYIGKNVISPAFMKLLNSVLVSQGLFLVRDGVLNDFKVAKIEQDNASKDTVNVEVSVLVKYPVNYIKIKLVF